MGAGWGQRHRLVLSNLIERTGEGRMKRMVTWDSHKEGEDMNPRKGQMMGMVRNLPRGLQAGAEIAPFQGFYFPLHIMERHILQLHINMYPVLGRGSR